MARIKSIRWSNFNPNSTSVAPVTKRLNIALFHQSSSNILCEFLLDVVLGPCVKVFLVQETKSRVIPVGFHPRGRRPRRGQQLNGALAHFLRSLDYGNLQRRVRELMKNKSDTQELRIWELRSRSRGRRRRAEWECFVKRETRPPCTRNPPMSGWIWTDLSHLRCRRRRCRCAWKNRSRRLARGQNSTRCRLWRNMTCIFRDFRKGRTCENNLQIIY